MSNTINLRALKGWAEEVIARGEVTPPDPLPPHLRPPETSIEALTDFLISLHREVLAAETLALILARIEMVILKLGLGERGDLNYPHLLATRRRLYNSFHEVPVPVSVAVQPGFRHEIAHTRLVDEAARVRALRARAGGKVIFI